MKVTLMFLCFLLAAAAYGNDTFIYNSVGGTMLTSGASDGIYLVSEVIDVTMHDTGFSVDVTMEFENSKDSQTVMVGFPVFSKADSGHSPAKEFRDFRSYVDDQETDFTLRRIPDYAGEGLDFFYVREIQFKANGATRTRVTYTSKYSEVGFGTIAPYMFGTGSTWSKKPWLLQMSIHNESDNWVYDLMVGPHNGTLSSSGNTTKLEIVDVLPTKLDEMIEIWSRPGVLDDPEEFSRWYPRGVDEEKLKLLTVDQLRLLRNYFYALHGYPFESQSLKAFFGKTYWYKPNKAFTEELLTAEERETVALISQEERGR